MLMLKKKCNRGRPRDFISANKKNIVLRFVFHKKICVSP